MATPFGNPNGGPYPLGKLTVAVVGTVIPLSTNVPITTQFGTPATGVAGLTTKGTPSQLVCATLKVMADAANTGNIYLVYKGQAAAAGSGTSVVLVVAPGKSEELRSEDGSNRFQLDQLALDADTNLNKAWVTALVQ